MGVAISVREERKASVETRLVAARKEANQVAKTIDKEARAAKR
jgi:hypothetical protein